MRRVLPVHHAQAELHAARAASGDHGTAVGERQRHGLFAEDVLLRGGYLLRLLRVQAVGAGHVDDVDLRVVQQRLQRCIAARGAMLACEGFGT